MSVNLRIESGLLQIAGNAEGGGTSDYSELANKPQINNVELNGNKSSAELGILSLNGGTMNDKSVINMTGEYEEDGETYHSLLNISDSELKFSYDDGFLPSMTQIHQSGIDVTRGSLYLFESLFRVISGTVDITPNITFENDIVSKDGTISLRTLAQTVGQANALLEEV